MTQDRETPDRNAPGTPQMSVIEGGKGRTPKGVKTPLNRATGLTAAQEQFCQGVMSGLNYTAAYRAAYPNCQSADPTIWSMACRMAADARVIARLEQMRGQKEAEMRMQGASRSSFVLSELQKMATDQDIPPAVKVRALELMGKTVALFTDRVETEDVTDRSADEIEAQIKARLGLS